MLPYIPYVIGGAVAVSTAVIGFISGSVYRRKSAEQTIGSAEDEARRILNDAMKTAESKKKEILIEAKEEIHLRVIKPATLLLCLVHWKWDGGSGSGSGKLKLGALV